MFTDIRGDAQQEYWDSRAAGYGNQYGLQTETTSLKISRKVALLFQMAGISATDNVLEIGCGTGLYTGEIKKRCRLTAADLSPEMLKRARSNHYDVPFVQMDCRRLQGTYDAVIACYLLQHAETSLCLPEIRRVLHDGGKLAIIVPNILNPIHWARAHGLFRETSDSVDFTRWEWARLLKRHGFREVKVKPVEFISPYISVNTMRKLEKWNRLLESLPLVRETAGSLLIAAKAG